MRLLPIMLMLPLFIGCATVRVHVASEPLGAEASYFDKENNLTVKCLTPCQIPVKQSLSKQTIVVQKTGFLPESREIGLDRKTLGKTVLYSVPLVIGLGLVLPEPWPLLGVGVIRVENLDSINVRLNQADVAEAD